MIYYCVYCTKKLNGNKKKYCNNICKCRNFYKEHPDKCNKWNNENPKPKVKNKCLNCGKLCGRKKYCCDKCKPKIKTITIQPYWVGMARFNTKCIICSKTFYLTHIHHLNGNHNDNNKENLTNVCQRHHNMIHTSRNEFKESLINEEILKKLKYYRSMIDN